jgi:hypothetical protein
MKRAPGAHWIEGWVGPRAGLDVVVKRKIPSPCRDSNPPIMQSVAQSYTAELSRQFKYLLFLSATIHKGYMSQLTNSMEQRFL